MAQGLNLKELPVAEGAEFGTYMDQHEEGCLPGTREELLREIDEWAVLPQSRCIFWLNGSAGTGKSTISRTVANFFFKRGEGGRGNATRFFPTIARQLFTQIAEIQPVIMHVLNDDFDKLILQPLLNFKKSNTPGRVLNDSNIQQARLVQLRVFHEVGDDHQDFILHQIPSPIIKRDISLFLEHKLAKIRKERSLQPDWPGATKTQRLITMSVPLFIFAATICQGSLSEILDHQNDTSKLNGTYLPVLDRLLVGQEYRMVLGTIILLESPLSLHALANFLGRPESFLDTRLNSLHSVLDIPHNKMLPIRAFHLSLRDFLVNADTCENTPLWIDEKEINQDLTARCLHVMNQNLKKNICNLPSYGTVRMTISRQHISDRLPPELQYSCRYWTHHLTHSRDAISWSDKILAFLNDHFLHWVEVMSLLDAISEALQSINTLKLAMQGRKDSEINKFLCDAERFILKNSQMVDVAPLQLYVQTCPRVEDTWSPELRTLEGHSRIVRSVTFSPDGQQLASGSDDKTIKIWDPATGHLRHTLEGHSSSVKSVAFSPDNQQLASGSNDKTIKIWNPATGYLRHTLEGHSNLVWSVAFSPDGQQLASGSFDNTIKIWNPITGHLRYTLEGYSSRVWSVAFSPDSQQLASGSLDKTIKTWDLTTGYLRHALEDHSSRVESVAFSPDGQQLASGSDDKTIKIWDPTTGHLRHTLEDHSSSQLASGSFDKTIKIWDPTTGHLRRTLEGHFSLVESVAFSPDSQQLASGSDENTIKIWDPATGYLRHTLEDHSSKVESVAFSPDGQQLASGSDDKTIKIWDPATSHLRRTLEGHFSRVCQQLASGSFDKTIKIWDPTTGYLRYTLEGHFSSVWSVAFSPDSQQLASGSLDKTIKIWDPITGHLRHTLEGHSSSVWSMAFSPDSQQLASGSEDKTIKIWDPATGQLGETLDTMGILVVEIYKYQNSHFICNTGWAARSWWATRLGNTLACGVFDDSAPAGIGR
ncbi:WD40-repeat-containing domain protein [Aspergillus candidus]|uniref:Mitochondrial division protein 1 n=1 Tax=Aspergillus candidus TaxID=41067 RepID=A0A2I2FM43_ASPCN|nr:WD40-repeat-containing domain protein [Aspergillus candidus]PLB41707.1 WD40-repeat-containing domain protein [Aspergillus candidus]